MIGFVGLGRMGWGMAANLLRNADQDVVVFDVNPEAANELIELGAQPSESVADLARRSSVIFMSLPGPPEVEAVVRGTGGVFESVRPDTAVFDLSTNSISVQRTLHDDLARRGAVFLDAPVSGGPAGAASGDLAIWVGGDRDVFDRHLPLLQAFSNKPKYVGALGAGTVTKLCHNMLGSMIQLALAECFSLGVKAGVDPLDLWESIRLGMVGKQSPLDMLTKQFLPNDYDTPSMALRLGRKDIALATAMSRELGVPMRMADLTYAEMTEAIAKGFGDQDARAFLKLQLERAGVEIAVDRQRLAAALDAARTT